MLPHDSLPLFLAPLLPLCLAPSLQGGRSTDGSIKEFKPGAFSLAIDEGVPIVPLVLDGTSDCLTAGKVCMPMGEVGVGLGRERCVGMLKSRRKICGTRFNVWCTSACK